MYDEFRLKRTEIIRRQSLEELRKLGINPYPAAKYEVNTTSKEILSKYDPEKNNLQEVCLAGRITSRRIMGSASLLRYKIVQVKFRFTLSVIISAQMKIKHYTILYLKTFRYW